MTPFSRALLLLTPLLVIGCGRDSRSQLLDLRAVGLRTSDLPANTTADLMKLVDNARAARQDGVPVTRYVRHGRVRSYAQSFFHIPIDTARPSWMERADDEITEYRTETGAAWGFRHAQQQLLTIGVESNVSSATLANPAIHRYDYRRVRPAKIGDATTELQATWPSDENAYTTRVILFRRCRVVVFLRVVGTEGNIPWRPVLHLGRILDGRLKVALAATS